MVLAWKIWRASQDITPRADNPAQWPPDLFFCDAVGDFLPDRFTHFDFLSLVLNTKSGAGGQQSLVLTLMAVDMTGS